MGISCRSMNATKCLKRMRLMMLFNSLDALWCPMPAGQGVPVCHPLLYKGFGTGTLTYHGLRERHRSKSASLPRGFCTQARVFGTDLVVFGTEHTFGMFL